MTTLAPEKPTGTRCGEMVQSGIVAYPCELGQGHTMIPEADPEPHYAVEVGRTVRAWQAWRQRQMEREAHPGMTILGGITCPTCGKPMRESNAHGLQAVCIDPECKQEPIHIAGQQTVTEEASPTQVVMGGVTTGVAAEGTADHGSGGFLRQHPGAEALWEDVTDLGRINASETLEAYSCPRTILHSHHYWGLKAEVPVYQCKGDLSDPPAVANDDPRFAAEEDESLAGFVERLHTEPSASAYDEEEAVVRPIRSLDSDDLARAGEYPSADVTGVPFEPSKQREGDQPLPDGGYACVQDAVIAAMEESKAVGLQRYGSVLMTFNGRKGIQDVYEEVRDLFVYLTQVKMEAEVTREQLEVVVTNRLTPLLEARSVYQDPDQARREAEPFAAVAVDAVMGWVTGQSPQSMPSDGPG